MAAAKNIHEAILSVMSKVGYVQKKGRNTSQGYNFAQEVDVMDLLRPHMIEAGITLAHVGISDLTITPAGKMFNVRAIYTVRFHHSPSNTHLDTQAIGEGFDAGDKASYKAAAGANKYALLKTFFLSAGDDPENDPPPGDDGAQEVTPEMAERTKRALADSLTEKKAWKALVTAYNAAFKAEYKKAATEQERGTALKALGTAIPEHFGEDKLASKTEICERAKALIEAGSVCLYSGAILEPTGEAT